MCSAPPSSRHPTKTFEQSVDGHFCQSYLRHKLQHHRCLGIDISIKNIQDEILRVHFLETGYAILCESASRLVKVTRKSCRLCPKFSRAGKDGKVSLKDVIPDVTGNATLFNRLWGQSGVSYFESSSKRYLLAYSSAKSTMFRERYTVMVVIPEDEALVEIPALKKRILNTETEVVSTVSATTVPTALLTIVVVIVVTNWISNPVQVDGAHRRINRAWSGGTKPSSERFR